MPKRLKIFFDGGCRPNPGAMEIAVVIGGQVHIDRTLGHGTSMDAEWFALIMALRLAQSHDLHAPVLLGDCAAVIDQANGNAKIRGDAVRHLDALQSVIGRTALPHIRYIKRSHNLAGIALASHHPR